MTAQHAELPALLDRSAQLKEKLVAFAQTHFREALEARFHELGSHARKLDPWEVAGAIDDVIYDTEPVDGDTVLSRFAANEDLSVADRALVLSWRESFWGMFEVLERSGRLVRTRNLVDDLDYVLVATTRDPQTLEHLGRPGFIFTRIAKLGDQWMVSGLQSVLKPSDRVRALAIAAKMAMERPELRFRNPEFVRTEGDAVPLSTEMVEALRAWQDAAPARSRNRPHAPNRKDKRKKEKASRRKNRR